MEAILEVLGKLQAAAEEMSLDLLGAAAVSAEASVYGELQDDFSEAISVVERACESWNFGPDALFWVRKTIAFMAYDRGDDDTALRWLDFAIEGAGTLFEPEAVHASLRRADVIGRRDPAAAVQATDRAVDVAIAGDDTLLAVKAYGERSIAAWLAGDLDVAFLASRRAAELLLRTKSDDEAWREVFVVFAHVLGYLTSLASTGDPPAATEDGGPYAPPFRCVFLNVVEGRADWYDEAKFPAILMQLAVFAGGVGRHEEAAEWARRALTAIENTRASRFALALIPYLKAAAFVEGDYETVLRRALDVAWLASVKDDAERQRGFEVAGSQRDDKWGSADADTRLWVEGHAFNHAFIPIVIQLAHKRMLGTDDLADLVDRASTALREMAVDAADPDSWTAGAELLGEIFVGAIGPDELIATGEQQQTQSSTTKEALRYAAYLGASLRDVIPEKALALHLTGVWFYGPRLAADNPVYADLLADFFHEFWTQRFNASRFRFSNPSLVSERLTAAIELEGENRVKAVVGAVAESLTSGPLKPVVADWLYD
jgi:tetratricopeptide (TPR) repeat protein